MATIGSFQKTANGFSGRITGLMFDVSVEFQPNRKDHDKAPDYRRAGRGLLAEQYNF